MISICCCAINAKFDVEGFVRAIHQHNQDVEFEIVLVHDDRVNDGSAEYLSKLADEFPRLKLVRHTHEDTVDYLNKLMNHYDKNNILDASIRTQLRENLIKFTNRELFDHSRTFLWLTSGVLYNKAVMASSGNLLVISPADFLYLFKLKDLENIANARTKDGHFYGKPNAIWARISTFETGWLTSYVNDCHNGIGNREGYRWDSNELFRDYLDNPQTCDKLKLCDIYSNKVIPFSNFGDFKEVYEFNNNSFKIGGVQTIPSFHGYHTMTRKTYDAIGGFTEEWYGRAFADDKMTHLGRKYSGGRLPNEISIAWCGQSEMIIASLRPLPEDLRPALDKTKPLPFDWKELLKKIDPLCDEHLMSHRDTPKFLHYGLIHDHQASGWVSKYFSQGTPPVRIL